MKTFAAHLSVRHGVTWFRWHGRGLAFYAPWKDALFSERHGFRRPLFRLFGFRIFRLEAA